MKDYTMLFKTIYTVLFIIISYFILPWVKGWLETKINEINDKRVVELVRQAVEAFEEIYKTLPKSGEVKKSEVLEFVNEMLKEYGVSINQNFLDKMIEALVYEMNERQKKHESD